MKLVALLLAVLVPQGLLRAIESTRPNIIFILASDVGFGDLGCYGARHVQTPNLDRLAAQGCRFTDAHAPASIGTPFRRAFLTGVYSWRQTAGAVPGNGDASLCIPPGTTTLPTLLKQTGYRTGFIGQWHLGLGGQNGPNWNSEIKPGPLELDFDQAFFLPASPDRVPTVFIEDRRVAGLDARDPLLVSYVAKVGLDPTGSENSALLKLWHYDGHTNTIVNGIARYGWMSGGNAARWKDEDLAETLTAKAVQFIDTNRSRPFFLCFAPNNIHVPRSPHSRFKGASAVGARGDAIHELDASVGRLLARLDELQLAHHTLVIFTSDNGGILEDGYYDAGRANYSPNGPLRGWKGTIFEGGHRVPFIVNWPGRIRPGTTSDALFAHLDMPATLAALTGARIPEGQCRDSVNVLPAILGAARTGREELITHSTGTRGPFALRQKNWKLIQPGPGPGYGKMSAARAETRNPQTPMLFELASDPGETKNLATELNPRLREMQAALVRLRGGK